MADEIGKDSAPNSTAKPAAMEAQQNSVDGSQPAPLSKRLGVQASGLESGFYSVTFFFLTTLPAWQVDT